MDAEHRPFKFWAHKLGQPQERDDCLFVEDDQMFWIDISMSCSGRFVIVSSSSPMTSEVHLIDLESTKPAALTLVEPRE